MTLSSREEADHSTSEQLALEPYLRAVAAALSAPNATAETVLKAARARGARRIDAFVEFAVPDPRVVTASLRLGEEYFAGPPPRWGEFRPDLPPSSVEFRLRRDGSPVTLAEVAQAFGTWTDDVAGTTPEQPYLVQFTTFYPPELVPARPDGPLTHVMLSLAARPQTKDVRVRSVLLRRFGGNP